MNFILIKIRVKLFDLILYSLVFLTSLYMHSPSSFASEDTSQWILTDQTSVRLISASTSIGNNQGVRLGLHFKMIEGWKIYWRSPGDAGFPPSLSWKNSENLKKIEFGWPLPSRFSVTGLQTLGYKNEVVFPIKAKVRDINKDLKLRADLSYLACNDICIPYKTKLSLDIPAGKIIKEISENSFLIGKYSSKIPGNGKAHKISMKSVETIGRFVEADDNIRKGFISILVKSEIPFKDPDIFVEGPELTFFGLPQTLLSSNKLTAIIKVPVTEEEDAKLISSVLRLTIKDGERFAEQTLVVTTGKDILKIPDSPSFSLPLIFVFALLGGLILNLMPCVLPVISLKIISVISYGNADPKTVRKSFIASSLGIIFSFLVIAGGLIILKLSGSAIGWGIQFQYPWFIVGLSIIVTLFSYNLWGLFEVHLPIWISNLANYSNKRSPSHPTFTNNFITGAFATLLATPCSAPFLGTAVGFALAGSVIDILVVFFALGVGMALPFLIITVFPHLATKMPRPGNWMITFKKILATALAGTAVWLLLILATQIGNTAATFVAILMILVGLILIAQNYLNKTAQRMASFGILALVLVAFGTPFVIIPSSNKIENWQNTHWQKFDPNTIPGLVAQGKTVFVDITAQWCITCQINKTTILRHEQIRNILTSGKIIAMRGDWTRPDAKISVYLKTFNRYGIPFNAIYGPGIPLGKPLPELLTTGIVLENFKKASNGIISKKTQF
jgi:suppressor for copper-sensitivity B